ncbi:MAG: FHA domain-containing protein [Planctomycetota bacterium]
MNELLISTADGRTLAQGPLEPTRAYWIGRESQCDFTLGDPSVSAKHALVFCAAGRWHVADAGSLTGLETEAGPTRAAVFAADAWIKVGSVYLWLSGPIPPAGEMPDGSRSDPARPVKLAIERDPSEPAPETDPAPAEVLTVSDAAGAVHLCADLTGAAGRKATGVPRILVGRAACCDLQILHPSVDPVHCVLALGAQHWSLVDAGCEDGIMIAGKRWYRKRMEPGTSVPVGDFALSVVRLARTQAALEVPGLDGAPSPRRPSAFLG